MRPHGFVPLNSEWRDGRPKGALPELLERAARRSLVGDTRSQFRLSHRETPSSYPPRSGSRLLMLYRVVVPSLDRTDVKQTRPRYLWQSFILEDALGAHSQVHSRIWFPMTTAVASGLVRRWLMQCKGDRICETNQEVEADEKWRALALVDPVWLPNHT